MKWLLLSSLSLLALHLGAQKPKVLVLTTGGTIASRTDAPLIDGPELIRAVPELGAYAEIEVESVVRIGSSKMTPVIWLQLVQRIAKILESRDDITGIVITHGTDTMEETAFFLNLTHRFDTPIVLVGSMRSTNEVSADGPANLLNAVRVAVNPVSRGKGVLVVLNENISAASDLYKMHNRRVDAFGAPEFGFLGSVDPDRVIFYRQPLQPHTQDSPFDVTGLDSLPVVDLLRDFAGFPVEIGQYFMERPTAGLVLSTFAGGRMSQGMTNTVRNAENGGKPIVIASGVKQGRIFGRYPGTPVIVASDLPPNKARILLMLALTKTQDPRELQAIFDTF